MKHFFTIPLLSGNPNHFLLIAGPCVVESQDNVFEIAQRLQTICQKLEIPLIFKASYKKANRSKASSFTGIGDEKALEIIAQAGKKFALPTITDVHSVEDCFLAAKYVDALQIPAFLCRQTDLLEAAARTGKAVNIKKGQFMSPEAMGFAVEKVKSAATNPAAPIFLTERGTTFGYTDLVVDFRGIPAMQQFAPTILDVTHSLQQPNQTSGVTGGLPALIESIARAGIAIGVDGLFIETHPDPKNAKSDGANMLPLSEIEGLLKKLLALRKTVLSFEK